MLMAHWRRKGYAQLNHTRHHNWSQFLKAFSVANWPHGRLPEPQVLMALHDALGALEVGICIYI